MRTKGAISFVSISLRDLNKYFNKGAQIIVSRRFLEHNRITNGQYVKYSGNGVVSEAPKPKPRKQASEYKQYRTAFQCSTPTGDIVCGVVRSSPKNLIKRFENSTTPLITINGRPVSEYQTKV